MLNPLKGWLIAMQMEIKCLIVEDVKSLHYFSIEYFGGSIQYFPNTESKIESILSQQYEYFGHDEYPTVYEKSAMLFYMFVKGHCFVDGNKRTGLGSMLKMFSINDYVDIDPEYDWYEFAYSIAESKYRNDDIKKYIKWITEMLKTKFVRVV